MKKTITLFLILISMTLPNFTWAKEIPTLRLVSGVELNTFDPSLAEDFITLRILYNLGEGLVRLDKNLSPIEALATWKISKDQKKYTFQLKKNIFWSDGSPITVDQFMTGFQRTLSPQNIAKLAEPFVDIIEGARLFKNNKVDFTKVGINSPNETTLVFTLVHPSPYFLSLLALPFSYPQRSDATGSFLIKEGTPTSGPYFIKKLKQGALFLSPNLKSKNPAKNHLDMRVAKDSATVLSLYEKGQIDVMEKIPSNDFKRLKNDPALVATPFLATYYLGFNITKPPFDDINNRRLIVQSIDRNELHKILLDPQHVSSSFVPRPLLGYKKNYGPYFKGPTSKDSLGTLKDVKNFELVFDSQEKNTLIAAFIQEQIKKNLGLKLELRSFDWKSYLNLLSTATPSLFRFAWLAPFADPVSHLGVFTSANPNNYTGYKNPKYDALVDDISRTIDIKKREKLVQSAQKILIEDDIIVMPLYHYTQYHLISQRWRGIEVTPMGLLDFHLATLKREP